MVAKARAPKKQGEQKESVEPAVLGGMAGPQSWSSRLLPQEQPVLVPCPDRWWGTEKLISRFAAVFARSARPFARPFPGQDAVQDSGKRDLPCGAENWPGPWFRRRWGHQN